ncbi:cyclic nucleotide-binding domain-containing protein [Vibrio sp. SS-MA-C1-2]|uniref:cyclic nucleotide-binding domain-containing protein n=1 Tax=Vibrio sp. SS-MA-C1-2 TaxID=2908646 RepID=UPI001F3697CF|nr:cyclic nucleotide-binding domain-containing protein [Vibrio sp. SS-MA-C1-2]UJF16965.1 cyclic nucleotide-binding domain-containing protein [Vibrio sp. SS-MA-C1-2]
MRSEANRAENIAWIEKHCTVRTYPPKVNIISKGDNSNSLFAIIDGTAKVILINEDGREVILSYLNKNDYFGEMSFFCRSDRVTTVRTKSDCKIIEIDYDKFQQLVKQRPEILIDLSTSIADRLLKVNKQVTALNFLDTRGRIAKTLLDLAKEPSAITHPDGMLVYISRTEIAKIVNCNRESVGRALKEFENQGLISARGKSIVVYGTR